MEDALLDRFRDDAEELLLQFVRLLAFDAIVGNNDRHYYNWGIVTDLARRQPPRFSPIYDTARALYWNTPDKALLKMAGDPNRKQTRMAKYVEKCYPKIGWDGLESPNHFGLMRAISSNRPTYRTLLAGMCPPDLTGQVRVLMRTDFSGLISPLRADFIAECLDHRARMFNEALET